MQKIAKVQFIKMLKKCTRKRLNNLKMKQKNRNKNL